MKASLSKSLIIILLLFGLLGLLLGGGVSYINTKSKLADAYLVEQQAITEMAKASLIEAVFVYDFEQAQAIVDALVQSPILNAVEVVDQRGKAISQASMAKQKQSFNQVELQRGEDFIGTLKLQFDESSVIATLNSEITNVMLNIILVLAVVVAAVFFYVRKLVVIPINDVANSLHQIATGDGDLTRRIPVHNSNEIGVLSSNFNLLMDNLSNLLVSIRSVSEQVSSVSHSLSSSSSESQRDSLSQQDQMEQAATSLQEMSASAEEVFVNAEQTADKSQTAREQTLRGVELVRENSQLISRLSQSITDTSSRIDKLIDSSSAIGSVVEVIRNIAEQTNLLALNAAIEAARAGEQGRGFAVVADEVRALAQKTQESTQEIESIVAALQDNASNAASSMGASLQSSKEVDNAAGSISQALQDICEHIENINQMNTHVAVAAKQQNSVTQTIAENVTTLNTLASSIANNAKNVNGQVISLEEHNNELVVNIKRFKV
ncbi:methyl-accepting chemotaxis protein [Agarivorans sp. Alg241-V36]|uniref:methyl-accepting chemotaxis protein n=1 Tax=Agarivorans sp. Alg241-V36 TaxID=2305992 RepID=UPI0013D15692|nr:HAMP domain-containing methyl-accepting chemotaxis protein [Agarivorans sp. Alg241-V36]